LQEAYEEWLKAGSLLNIINRGAEVDEMAILFSSTYDLDEFVTAASEVAPMFNEVPRDQMVRQDKPGSFYVRFKFLQAPRQPFRLECMTVIMGNAPLHDRLFAKKERPCIMHASYKLESQGAYEREKSRLRSLMKMRAEYQNSYGMFSYWQHFDMGGVYLKPRVNLRDSSSALGLSGEFSA